MGASIALTRDLPCEVFFFLCCWVLTRNWFFIAHAAGISTTTNAGVSSTSTTQIVTPQNAIGGLGDQLPPAVVAAAPATIPFYKRRWFLVSTIIMVLLGIALLFIILFPVLRAIVELVVKRSNLHVDLASITQPQNGSWVHLPLTLHQTCNFFLRTSNRFQLALQGKVSIWCIQMRLNVKLFFSRSSILA